MRRRTFIATSGGMAIAWPLAAAGQPREKQRVIGVVLSAGPVAAISPPNPIRPTRAFLRRMRELGWIEGRNLIVERRSADGRPERAAVIFAELVSAGCEAIWLGGPEWIFRAALGTTSTVPLVGQFGGDPVAWGLVASLARPGGNLTGITRSTGIENVRKRLQLLMELAPRTTRIAYLLGTAAQVQDLPPDLAPGGTRLVYAVGRPDELDEVFALILREGCDAMYDGGHYFVRSRIIAFAAQHRLPAIYGYREAVEDGGLISYGPDFVDDNVQAAELFDRILRGAKPADLPVRQLDRFELLINRRTAEALGLTITPTLEARAEVIE